MAQTLNTPQVLNQPIANNGDKNVIPNTNDQSTGLMSMSAGFPPVTSQRIADGGIPPRRSDVNGALNLISQQHYFLQNGGTYTFRQDVSNAIGGYPKNAILYYEDPDGNLTLVRSLVENNTNNFVNDPSLIDGVNWERLSLGIANANIGQIIQVACAPDYTPFGTLPCDGSQYSSSRFPTLWQNYLTADTPLLNTCTLEEWEAEVASNGQCLKFAVDTTNNVFKVPLIKDGTHLQQALADDELSKFYSDGLPALDLSTVGAHTHTRGTMNITGGPIHINAYGPGNITSGAFRTVATGASHNDSGGTGVDIYFNAENAWTGATSSNGNHTHTFTSSKVGKYNTVQPVSFGIRFFVVVANAVRNESMMDWSQWQSDLQGKASIDLNNLSSAGESHFDNRYLNYNQVTRCLTEIPQDILVELVDGTVTLKESSKVYYADGSSQVITIDISRSVGNGLSVYVYTKNGNFRDMPVTNCFSGDTQPTNFGNYCIWYDTNSNVLKYTSNAFSSYEECSFPVCLCSTENSVPISIDQVFNGFGYIGSTMFYLPNVQGKTANGLNPDGTYKGTNFKTTNVVTRTFSSSDNGERYLGVYGSNLNITYNNYNSYVYDIKTNQYINTNENKEWADVCVFGLCTMTRGVISNFRPCSTFQAVDRNDTSWLSGLGMPEGNVFEDLSLPAGGTPMIAPANGYVQLWMTSTTTSGYVQLSSGAMVIYEHSRGGTGPMVIVMPVKKGADFAPQYNSSNTLNRFRFIYAVGEV